MFEIKKLVKKGDYLYAVVPEHPNATSNGYVLHHRVVMENHIGRLLTADEVVHHKDKNKKNNEVENLEVMHKKEHNRMHSSTGRIYITFTCPNCGKEFKRPKKGKFVKEPKCSRRCNGQYSRKIQLGLI